MNFMGKLFSGPGGGGRGLSSGGGSSDAGGGASQDHSLSLMHLRKLFGEFRHPTAGTPQKELEDKLYNMLPLFCKIFGTAPSSDMTEKFGDILQFCGHVSRLMVSEIRQRAANQSTEAASCAIVKFLEIESSEETSNGWMLLSAINLLSLGPMSLIDCMTAASLPSTLVKCLYLFFDLPPLTDEDRLEAGCQFTPRERRVLLQKVVAQVLVRLCSHASPAEELARKDDLTLLFSAITSWCPQHNVPWRKSAAEVLMTLSRHGLTPNVVQYIHSKGCLAVSVGNLTRFAECIEHLEGKGCVALCIDNMQRVQELSPIELVEMFVTVFCFLKDSSEVSHMLLDDFRSCQGYQFLTEFLLKMEKDQKEESIHALRNLVLLVGSLTTCGFLEMKPSTAASGSLFQMPGFSTPQPSGKGVSVRNSQAFQVLQTVFLKGSSSALCNTILDVISSIYHQDNANYFILEPQATLSQLAEKIHLKPVEIQMKFFELLEFIVFNLNFVPCKELISLSLLIKTNHSVQCSILCIRSLLRIVRYHGVYKDVFREVGLLEVLVSCLHRFNALLKEPNSADDGGGQEVLHNDLEPIEQEMGYLVMDILTQLLSGNHSNAGVFRESGGARCSHNMVPHVLVRPQALGIVQQLVLSTGGDDDMGTLLGLMHTAPATALGLKTAILKSLLNVLRESHRTRTVFRKVGGFVYVMSVLVTMEGCLSDPPKAPWDTVGRKEVLTLLKSVFSTLTVAMRYEPANARFFATEIRYTSLKETVRLLGCFSPSNHLERQRGGGGGGGGGHSPGQRQGYSNGEWETSSRLVPNQDSPFTEYFYTLKDQKFSEEPPMKLKSACLTLKFLYDMALDNFEKQLGSTSSSQTGSPCSNNSPNMKRVTSVLESVGSAGENDLLPTSGGGLGAHHKRASTGSLVLPLNNAPPSDPLVVHAGAVISMLHLVPAIEADSQLGLDLQWSVCEVIKTLLQKSERNQQVMCEAGLPHELLTYCSAALADEAHVLHPPLHYMLERLAAHSLTPKDLRDFLRLSNPLCCAIEDEVTYDAKIAASNASSGVTFAVDKALPMLSEKAAATAQAINHQHINSQQHPQHPQATPTNGGPVPLTRVKCLVSMTTPRDVRLHGAAITPAFVEFDLASEGFGCLYLPSMAPQGPSTPSVVSGGMIGGAEPGVVGGIGAGERMFPPASGLSFSTWICVDKFCTPVSDAHPVRLLSIVRGTNTGRPDQQLLCFQVWLAARDRALHVSTQEVHMPTAAATAGTGTAEFESEPILNDTNVRFWCPDLTQEGQWRHLVVVLHKAGIMKNSSVSLFVDGVPISTQKLHYISPNVGGSGTVPPGMSSTSVFAYVGTPPQLRRPSKLVWRQGPCHLFDDILPNTIISNMWLLGPNYVGSFQAPLYDTDEPLSPLVAEDKIVFGIHAHALSLMTVAKIRKVYTKVDAKSIAKQLGMSVHENATPIRILHNSASHLSGPARSFGAILMGYLGVRTFCPKPVAKMLLNVGGVSALLGLIAMARDVEGLYAAVKALVCTVRSNKAAQREMERKHGYQILAILLKRKHRLLNSHILHLTFSLVGTVDSGRETTVIPNRAAFNDLLCDLQVWQDAPGDLQRSLYEHYLELLTESSESRTNLRLLQELGLMGKLTALMRGCGGLSSPTLHTVTSVVAKLLSGPTHQHSLLCFGQFMVSLVPEVNTSEKSVQLDEGSSSPDPLVYNIQLRNNCLLILTKLLHTPKGNVNTSMCESVEDTLGYDWVLVFLSGHLHSSTVVLAMRLLLTMLAHPPCLTRFREGSSGGGWLANTHTVLNSQSFGMMLGGFHVGGSSSGKEKHQQQQQKMSTELNDDLCHVPGFVVLQWLLPAHAEVADLYFLLMGLLLQQQPKELTHNVQLSLDTLWPYLFGVPANQPLGKQSKTELCSEAAVCILSMVRAMLTQNWEGAEEGSWLREYPVTLLQFLLFLYHNHPSFAAMCYNPDFLSALGATLFPFSHTTHTESAFSSPVEDFKPFPGAEPIVLVKEKPTTPTSASLSSHPARSFVRDFLRMVVMDTLSLQQSNKSAPVIDLILEAGPEDASPGLRREYQTEMLSTLMEHLLAADVLLGDQAAMPAAAGGNYTHRAHNVFYLASRLVDKLWQGVFVRDPKEVFDFICQLIAQAKRKSSGNVSLNSVYTCLNRAVLYQLSRPLHAGVSEQMAVLDALHKLTSNRSLVFGPLNPDQEFIGCLCYCLLMLTDDPANICSPPSMRTTTWHVDPLDSSPNGPGGGSPGATADSSTERPLVDAPPPPPRPQAAAGANKHEDGYLLLATAAKRVWEELYVCKKPAIEEMFKVTFNQTSNPEMAALPASQKFAIPDLSTVRPQVLDAAQRMWCTYYDNERKNHYSQAQALPSQLQSKLQKVGHGVLRLASRKVKKEVTLKAHNSTAQEYGLCASNHITIVRDLVELQHKHEGKIKSHMEKYLLEDWSALETELLRERGLWGPPVGSDLDKWQLDNTEGPLRTRKRMLRNDMFYMHYPYRPELEDKGLKYKFALSKDSKKYFERYRSHSLVGEDIQLPRMNSINTSAGGTPTQENNVLSIPQQQQQQQQIMEEMPVNMPSLLPGLKRSSSQRPVSGIDQDSMGGSLGGGGSTDTPSGDPNIDDADTVDGEQVSENDVTKPDNQTLIRLLEEGEQIKHMFRCARIQGLDTVEGLLLFGKEHFYIVDGFTLLKSKEIVEIDSLPPNMHEPIIPKTQAGVPVIKNMCFKFLYEDVREVHTRRYLLQPIAIEVFSADGRNFLLAFPRKLRNKVHARYLQFSTGLRDSAQESVSGQRQNAKVEPGTGLIHSLIGEKSVTERWLRGDISNFEYLMCLNTLAGRSYNDLMQYPVFPWIVADYASQELDLNDPKTFRDLSKPMGAQTPDRLKQFNKRYTDWDDPQGETPPYHYGTHYSSAMIVASYLVRMEPFAQHFLRLQGGHFDLADRMFHSVGDAWMSASKHNMADVKELIPEFFYLPEFLVNGNNFDLGCKQSGVPLHDVILPTWAKGDPREFIRAHREALESDYVSAHLNEWIDLIFGFRQQGAPAVDVTNVFHHLFYEGNVDIYSIEDPLRRNATIGFINNFGQIPKQLFKKPHPQKKLSMPRPMDQLAMGPLLPSSSSASSPHHDRLFFHHLDNLRPSMQPIKELKSAVGEIHVQDKSVLAVDLNKVLVPPTYNKYVAWGFSDMSLRIGNYDSEKASGIYENLDNGEILCAACPNDKVLVTAGTSTVVCVWEIRRVKDKQSKQKLHLKQGLYGHTEPVTCLAASQGFNLIVSGSRDRTCIVWDLSRLVFVRQLRGHVAPVAAICVNEVTGDIATCAGTYLHVWSINGEEIASINTATGRNHQILCVAMSQMMEWDPRNVFMTGSTDGVVRMWSLEFVQVASNALLKSKQQQSEDQPSILPATSNPVPTPKSPMEALRPLLQGTPDFLEPDKDLIELGSSAGSQPGCFEVDEEVDEDDDEIEQGVDPMKQPQSPSTASFEMVSEAEVSQALDSMKLHQGMGPGWKGGAGASSAAGIGQQQQQQLREGFVWQKQLVFRSKLTMHTAYERKDNKEPAAVTCISVAKDHKTIYVGDAKGRVFSWTVTEQPGRGVADHWVKDDGGDSCATCSTKFSLVERRHHCRNCGQLFCSRCSRFETEIKRLRILKPVRVCQACYDTLRAQQAADNARKSTAALQV